MIVYRIANTNQWAADLSGTGAYLYGGRWNSAGKYALYTSENQALTMLELLVHVEESELSCDIYMTTIEINNEASIFQVPDSLLPDNWRFPGSLALKHEGDKLLANKNLIGFRVRSAVIPDEYNVILNPLHPDYSKLVKIKKIDLLKIDARLKGSG